MTIPSVKPPSQKAKRRLPFHRPGGILSSDSKNSSDSKVEDFLGFEREEIFLQQQSKVDEACEQNAVSDCETSTSDGESSV